VSWRCQNTWVRRPWTFPDLNLTGNYNHHRSSPNTSALEGNGLKIMILLRLSPLIPYNALDYISGVTSISLRDYALALIALLPGAFMICFVGASASSVTDTTSDESKTVKIITIVTGVLFGGMGVFAASYYSKQELDLVRRKEWILLGGRDSSHPCEATFPR
jgi:uncharacterized membrane protein YdjX (TVP38/TMEM64 family)